MLFRSLSIKTASIIGYIVNNIINFMNEFNEVYTKSVDELVVKYPMTNDEWVFINGRWNLYEIIDICVDTYGRNKHGIYRMTLLEKQAYNTRMAACMRYKHIDRFFVRYFVLVLN